MSRLSTKHLERLEKLAEQVQQQRQRVQPGKYAGRPVDYCREVLKVQPWAKQCELMEAIFKPPYKVLGKSSHSIGKCVAEDEIIPLADGRIVQAKDLVGRHFVLLGWDEKTSQHGPAMGFAEDNGVRQVYRVTTHSGRTIVRTGNHPLWVGSKVVRHGHPVVRGGEWKPVEGITADDVVLVPLKIDCRGKRPIPEDHAKLMGYLLGDGGITTGITFTQKPGVVKDEFRAIVKKMGCKVVPTDAITDRVTGDGDEAKKEQGRNPVINLTRGWGIHGKRAKEKRLPDVAWELPDDLLALVLNRLFACDGWAYTTKAGSKARTVCVGIALASEGLIRDIELAMLRLGISGRIRQRTTTLSGKKFKSWEWTVYTVEMIKKFEAVVGIFGKEEAVRRAASIQQSERHITRWRTRSAPEGYQWDTVKSVEPLGEQRTVAICVPSTHAYLTTFVEHNTFVEACLVNFWFDTYNPGCVITTAPTYRDVCDLLWAQVRALRERVGLGGFSGARAPELYDGPEHYAKGFTASRGESFQGRHPERALFLFDEATGVDPVFWATARTMFQPTGMHAWLCMFNPTDTSSQAYAEELKVDLRGEPQWRTITISSPEHPNIQASLDGKPEPYPGAVSLAQFEDWLAAWSDPIDEREAKETDLEWPPGSGRWYRPGPLMEGRALGRYPSSATYGVWSDRAWKLATALSDHEPDLSVLPEIGCDVARHGDDYTAIHVRWGHLSLHHERHNGWEYQQTAERLKELCGVYAEFINRKRERQARPVDPQEILVKVDSDAYGWGVIEQREGYQFVGLSGCSRPLRPYEYSNRRSELWFHSMKLAKAGELCVARLSQEVQHRLRQQLFAPQWQPVSGLMRVEDKAITKQRLGASPDDADAFNLAYAPAMGIQMAEGIDVPDRPRQDSRDRDPRPGTRGLFGR